MTQKTTVYLGLGSNTPDRKVMLSRVRVLINLLLGKINNSSSLYVTSPWGFKDQEDFTNQVIELNTRYDIVEFHKRLLTIENHLGKYKTSKYGPRNIDIDILFFGDQIIIQKDLEIPHAQLHKRNFVLIPLAEIAPCIVHPVLKTTIQELKDECDDHSEVKLEEILLEKY